MKRTFRLAGIVAALAALVASGCAAHRPIRSVLYPDDDGVARIVPLRSRLAVSLDDPRRRGMAWVALEWDHAVLRLDGRARAERVKQVEGDPARAVLFFETIAEGETELRLAYCRPGDCEATVEDTYHVKIKVLPRSKIPAD